ncbi:hypothetical protein GGS24DRAFT_298180 [Hypoxylon argillaceum]|nr:hypothetical protein GGS24DRAFT_298180 [Hypoxylon argillaceum]
MLTLMMMLMAMLMAMLMMMFFFSSDLFSFFFGSVFINKYICSTDPLINISSRNGDASCPMFNAVQCSVFSDQFGKCISRQYDHPPTYVSTYVGR